MPEVTLVFDAIDAVQDENGCWQYNNVLADDFRMKVPETWTFRQVLSRLRKAGWHIPSGSLILDDSFAYDCTWILCCRTNGKPLWAFHELR